MTTTPLCHLQVAAAVALRREAWGGVAFDRAGGDLLELDAEGFAVLTLLKTAQPLPKTRVAFIAIKPSPARQKLADQQRRANALIEDYCKSDERLIYQVQARAAPVVSWPAVSKVNTSSFSC